MPIRTEPETGIFQVELTVTREQVRRNQQELAQRTHKMTGKLVHPDLLSAEARQLSMKKALKECLATTEQVGWSEPEFTVLEDHPAKDLHFQVRVPVLPRIQLPAYPMALEVPEVQSVTQSLLLSHLVEVQYQQATQRETSLPVDWEQRIEFSYYRCDANGELIPGTVVQQQIGLVRRDLVTPEFASALIGWQPNQTGQITLTDGSIYQVYLHQNFVLELPELNEAFPQRIGKGPTFKETFHALGQELLQRYQQNWRDFVKQQILTAYIDAANCVVPDLLLEAELRSNWAKIEEPALCFLGFDQQQRTNALQRWCQYEPMRFKIRQQLATHLVLREIAEKENLMATPEELTMILAPFCQMFKQPFADVYREMQRTGQLRTLLNQLSLDKATEFLRRQTVLMYEGQPLQQDF